MKVTRLGPPIPILNSGLGGNAGSRIPAGGNDLQVLTSNGSNGRYWGENVRRITSNGSNILLSPDVNIVAGAGIFAAVSSNTLTLTATGTGSGSALTIKDEGTPLATDATSLDFTGAGVTASGAGAAKTINIPGGGSSALTLIAETVLGSDTANITITGIPGTYKDLVIKILARSAGAGEVHVCKVQVGNGSIDTGGTNYAYGRFFDGTGTSTDNANSAAFISAGMVAGSSATAAAFDATSVEIFAYADTSVRRMFETHSQHYAADFYTNRGGGVWKNTADAIDQVRVSSSSGDLVTGSRMAIYGRG